MNNIFSYSKNSFQWNDKAVNGEFVTIGTNVFYKISNVDTMSPFFMSIVSHSNHWMFLTSNGGITAGRKDCDMALFPYVTDDKIIANAQKTGSTTIVRLFKEGTVHCWECFSEQQPQTYRVSRNLYKGIYGNKIIFEEINHDLQLSFQYAWQPSEEFGFVREVSLSNFADTPVEVQLLDGLQNMMPASVPYLLQNASSNLVNAYKRSELDEQNSLGIFSLSAVIVDRAEPSEALKANIAWHVGLDAQKYLLSANQLNAFRNGQSLQTEYDLKGEQGAFLGFWEGTINQHQSKNWYTIAEVNCSISKVVALQQSIRKSSDLIEVLKTSLKEDTNQLKSLVATADGLQCTGDMDADVRHFSNTMFNMMRGGVFDDNYRIEKTDFIQYLRRANKKLAHAVKKDLERLPETFDLPYLQQMLMQRPDKDLVRLSMEYLPLKFSRRHGDPSRPWNKFSIRTKDEIDGSKILYYEGNWRDIFQNWEALAFSYPEFTEGMVFKFLNASTFDGYNPYRVTKDGFDWETIEHDDPWSYIGYWGDHQIIYLLKLLEFIQMYNPQCLDDYMEEKLFVYAQVPYKIKTYEALVIDPKDTIVLDTEMESMLHNRKEVIGADGTLLYTTDGTLSRANFVEKMLSTLLAKLSNYIPETGIWMNTQRPEWNDANNALVGNGVSMVTLYYLRRFVKFLLKIWNNKKDVNLEVAKELAHYFYQIKNVFEDHLNLLDAGFSPEQKKSFLDRVGQAASSYREIIYSNGFSEQQMQISVADILDFFQIVLRFIEDTITKNKREDGLYHAYNLIRFEENSIEVSYLDEMLEGQVAVLSSGYLNTKQSIHLLNVLRNSRLYRTDQWSYLLYPNKELPGFLQKNTIASSWIQKSLLLQQLLQDENQQIIEKDVLGDYHFNGDFKNVDFLRAGLKKLDNKYAVLLEREKHLLEEIYESVFNHQAFTGRSGTFYGYEGLGSIYWHMVSKLLLAVQEIYWQGVVNKTPESDLSSLEVHLSEIEKGIGAHKSPTEYGAFPIDPYSHTPFHKGVQQPGMTGQVKEDILVRFRRLGLGIEDACITFRPNLLQASDYLSQDTSFSYFNVEGKAKSLALEKGSLAFTYCQIPILYIRAEENKILVLDHQKNKKEKAGLQLDRLTSNAIWKRNNSISTVIVYFKKA